MWLQIHSWVMHSARAKSLLFLALALAWLGSSPWGRAASAQSLVVYRDGDGIWRSIDTTDPLLVSPKVAFATETVGEAFTVTYRDVTERRGVGFDDPDLGDARRATMREVLLYIESVLDVP